jgi:hypothetical protein
VPPDPLPRQASWTVRKDRGLRRSSLAALLAAGCLASPPREVLAGDGWRVRADSAQEAREVGVLLEGPRPRLLAALPDSSLPPSLEVWMQDRPHLYALPIASTNEAEGLWAEDRSRILIARGADDIERTLAHEMTHAALGPSWRTLPGSLEEGLCDAVAARLCPGGSARLRADGSVPAGGHQVRQRRVAAQVRPVERDAEHRPPLRVIEVGKVHLTAHRRVVHQDVEPAERRHRGLDDRARALGHRHVGDDDGRRAAGRPDLLGHSLGVRPGRPRVDDNGRARSR